MKRFIKMLIILSTLTSSAFANEVVKADLAQNSVYLLLLKSPVNSVCSSNEKILKPEIMATIYNERDKILLKTGEKGKAKIYIETEKETVELEVVAGDRDFIPKELGTIIEEISAIDKIQEPKTTDFKLDEPPLLKREVTND